jgi:hypothetical protein
VVYGADAASAKEFQSGSVVVIRGGLGCKSVAAVRRTDASVIKRVKVNSTSSHADLLLVRRQGIGYGFSQDCLRTGVVLGQDSMERGQDV